VTSFMQAHINGVVCLAMLTFAAVCLLCGPAGGGTPRRTR